MRLVLLAAVLLFACAANAATTRSAVATTKCTPSNACFPWSPSGPACGRGANIAMRFQVQLNPPNYVTVAGLPEPVSNVTYAFCPRVDELQAFNITSVGPLAYTSLSSVNGTSIFMEPPRDQVYLWAIGFGGSSDPNIPSLDGPGRVMIADYYSYSSKLANQCELNNKIGVVPFLVMNVSMSGGRFKYYDGYDYPSGTGFVPSCDSGDVCLFDSSAPCIGPPGGLKNCGQCMTADEARQATLQIWVSYYGTDAGGNTLRSGASNPLNFQAYSGSGVASSMRKSFTAVQEGQTGSSSLGG